MNNNKAIGIIPARYASTRLHAKPLADVCGVPLVIRVWQNVIKSQFLSKVVIATDDERITDICHEFGAETILTPPELQSGTDRIYAAYKLLGGNERIIVNIQGDEPLLVANDVDKLLQNFSQSDSDVGTLITQIHDAEELPNPACVKVVLDKNNNAMYFSRSPIPHVRNENTADWLKSCNFWKHIGIYAYRLPALEKFVSLEQSQYELSEKLEQLRLLENFAKFLCVETSGTFIGVDTPEELEAVRDIIMNKN